MAQGQPTPQSQQRPWYYQNWFLIAAFILGWPIGMPFVLWPVWAVLIIRSPWHNKLLMRAPAWAMLLAGGGMLVRLLQSPDTAGIAVAIALPGLLVTVTTQVLWTRHKLELRAGGQPSNPPANPAEPPASSQRSRPRRRVQRRRGSRSGRSPRQP